MLFNQAVASLQFLLSGLKRPPRNRSKRIQIVDINSIHFMDRRVDVPRHRKVDNEKGPIAAHPEDWLERRPGDNRMRSSGETHQNVQILKFALPIIEADGPATDRFCQFCRSLKRTIRDKQLP